MKAYEDYGEVLPDGHLSLPEDLKGKTQNRFQDKGYASA
jgi:hypothetical protein